MFSSRCEVEGSPGRRPLNVFITVDTEFSSQAFSGELHLSKLLDRDIYGVTAEGAFGLPYQLGLLSAYGLRAVFFVEALSACVIGLGPLRQIVGMIQTQDQEVQMHLHSEWLTQTSAVLPGRIGKYLKDFSEDEQAILIAKGVENLQSCGVEKVRAFRAGNFGADFNTLRALARNGVSYDSSYNVCYLDATWRSRLPQPLIQPTVMQGVYEFPVSFFCDRPGHYRHTQLCACSGQELEQALLAAWKRGWYSFVIVTHSFELIKRPKEAGKLAQPNRILIKRFERLCRFLADHRDQFRTTGFADIIPAQIPTAAPPQPIQSGLHRTVWRYAEQLTGRVF